jgi:hypothetical protein
MAMTRRISIQAGSLTVAAALLENATADAIWDSLPVAGVVNRWGEEIYFALPVAVGLEHGQDVVDAGDIAYWPPGTAFCIFFGRTPASRGNEIRAASAVTVVGRLTGTPEDLGCVRDGETITVARME